jgi:hydroxyacylglutathione hydrolase
MIIRSWITDLEESNVHLIACEKTREAAIIDAGGFGDEMQREIERLGLRVTQILLTHSHYDHVDKLPDLKRAYGASILAAKAVTKDTRAVKDGDQVGVGELRGRVLQTSGHTPDCVSYVFEDHVVFTGDALFAGSVGGTQSPALQREELRNVREKILTLPDDCEIRCGHGPATTVGIERTANPFFA